MPEHLQMKCHRIEMVKIKEFSNIERLADSDPYFQVGGVRSVTADHLKPYLYQLSVSSSSSHRTSTILRV